MRILVKVQIPTELGNKLVRDHNFIKNIEDYIKKYNVEAAYFAETNGERTVFYVMQLPSPDEIAKAVEPLFQTFNGRVEIHPAMDLADLKKAFSNT